MISRKLSFIVMACCAFSSYATPATDSLLVKYRQSAPHPFSIQAGHELWTHTVTNSEGEKKSCQSCHGLDLTNEGKHIKTQKIIQPMALSVNPKRLTNEAKIEKWFKRNCNDVWERDCTAQEKGDLLTYLLVQ